MKAIPFGRRLWTIVGVMITIGVFLALAGSTALAAKTQDRKPLPGTKPAWTAAVTKTADVAASTPEGAKVWLAMRNASQLAAMAKAVSDPSSAQFHHFLSADQVRAQFLPTADQVDAVTQWLKGAGLQVDRVGPGNYFVEVSGTAAAMKAAFGAQLSLYLVKGKQELAPSTDFSIPSVVAPLVTTVTGLTTFGHRVQPADLGAPNGFVNATPCSAYYGEQMAADLPGFPKKKAVPYAVCGYTPSQLRGVYGVDASGLNGAGQIVAITDAFDSPTLLGDANTYAPLHGDPGFALGQFGDLSVPENPALASDCGGNGWYGEQTLDVEAVHAMALGALVAYYGAASCYDDDLLAQLAQVAVDDIASIVTNSWGEPTFIVIGGVRYPVISPGLISADENVFMTGALEGISFNFSSGDNGDELAAWGYKHPDYPAEDPWVTSVGGTSLAIGASNQRKFETGWGTSKWAFNGSGWTQTIPFQYGAGGGFTDPMLFMQPWYQNGVVKVNPTGGRAVPDVGMVGDPTTGFLVGETQNFALATVFGPAGVHYGEYRIGGTSLSSPLFAGVQADVESASGGRIGFANPLIYSLKSQVFFDPGKQTPAPGNVRADYANGLNPASGFLYSVRTFNQDSSLVTAKGWDDVTGRGTVTSRYITQMASIVAAP